MFFEEIPGTSNQKKKIEKESSKTYQEITIAKIEMRHNKNTLWTIISMKFEYVEEMNTFMEISNSPKLEMIKRIY